MFSAGEIYLLYMYIYFPVIFNFDRYGQNYTIGIRAKLEELESVADFMAANFPHSSLKVSTKLVTYCRQSKKCWLDDRKSFLYLVAVGKMLHKCLSTFLPGLRFFQHRSI